MKIANLLARNNKWLRKTYENSTSSSMNLAVFDPCQDSMGGLDDGTQKNGWHTLKPFTFCITNVDCFRDAPFPNEISISIASAFQRIRTIKNILSAISVGVYLADGCITNLKHLVTGGSSLPSIRGKSPPLVHLGFRLESPHQQVSTWNGYTLVARSAETPCSNPWTKRPHVYRDREPDDKTGIRAK